jgi:hypothetical protein
MHPFAQLDSLRIIRANLRINWVENGTKVSFLSF